MARRKGKWTLVCVIDYMALVLTAIALFLLLLFGSFFELAKDYWPVFHENWHDRFFTFSILLVFVALTLFGLSFLLKLVIFICKRFLQRA